MDLSVRFFALILNAPTGKPHFPRIINKLFAQNKYKYFPLPWKTPVVNGKGGDNLLHETGI